MNFRDLWLVLSAAKDREVRRHEESWRQTLILAQSIMNITARKPREITYLADRTFGSGRAARAGSVPLDEFKAEMKALHEMTMRRQGKNHGSN